MRRSSQLTAFAALALSVHALPNDATRPVEAVHRVGNVVVPHRAPAVTAPDGFDVLHHLSGNSPYFNAPGVGLTTDVPDGCSVTKAAYLIRHSDIYANDFEYTDSLAPFLYKLGNLTSAQRDALSQSSALSFVANWTNPLDKPEEQISQVTPLGKSDARALGALVAQRHSDILGAHGDAGFVVYAADATRDQDTAHAFIGGFASQAALSNVTLAVVAEGKNQSANTLTPHKSCETFDAAAGSKEKETFLSHYAPPVAARLNEQTPDAAPEARFNWTIDDVSAAQSMCGYETVIRNETSPWCGVFSEDEWLDYEYMNDLQYHRELGYGSPIAGALGIPWLRASADLLTGAASSNQSPPNASTAASQSLWLSFTHREEPPFVVTALGLYNSTNATMTPDKVDYARAWKTSQILPFLANVALERLECDATATGGWNASTNATSSGAGNSTFVRAVVNGAALPLPGCADGPGATCAEANFTAFLAGRAKLFGGQVAACGDKNANATDDVGIYAGFWPTGDGAVVLETVDANGTDEADEQSKNNNSAQDGKNGADQLGRSVVLAAALAAVSAAFSML